MGFVGGFFLQIIISSLRMSTIICNETWSFKESFLLSLISFSTQNQSIYVGHWRNIIPFTQPGIRSSWCMASLKQNEITLIETKASKKIYFQVQDIWSNVLRALCLNHFVLESIFSLYKSRNCLSQWWGKSVPQIQISKLTSEENASVRL